jgi:hypothetical protein
MQMSKKGNNPVLLKYYNDYFRILTAVINQTKRMTYEKQIRDTSNKIITTWNIIHREVRK